MRPFSAGSPSAHLESRKLLVHELLHPFLVGLGRVEPLFVLQPHTEFPRVILLLLLLCIRWALINLDHLLHVGDPRG